MIFSDPIFCSNNINSNGVLLTSADDLLSSIPTLSDVATTNNNPGGLIPAVHASSNLEQMLDPVSLATLFASTVTTPPAPALAKEGPREGLLRTKEIQTYFVEEENRGFRGVEAAVQNQQQQQVG